ncbi:MAG: hypothetical protein E6H04_14700 [Bacillati bacterium ANGP1]|uniref:DUF4198 domain-containing protein n=1 Tax=Candidatus Segetimicrobium genomatis TaxID=2569760 RepID=A0A537IZW6_9BACT|nr:MAG: hypothetical protein E6H04_14700 [Terrabacteria group bacterium ANGP1]
MEDTRRDRDHTHPPLRDRAARSSPRPLHRTNPRRRGRTGRRPEQPGRLRPRPDREARRAAGGRTILSPCRPRAAPAHRPGPGSSSSRLLLTASIRAPPASQRPNDAKAGRRAAPRILACFLWKEEMRMHKIQGLAVALVLSAALAAPAMAHEQRDAAGKPVNDLGDTLKVEVRFSGQTMGPLSLNPGYDPDAHLGVPGEYLAPVIPTRPGNYAFHFTGKIRNQTVDETFTTSEKTFDPAADPSAIEFPAKDPGVGELAMRIERLGPRIDAAQAAAAQLRTLAFTGIVLGAAGLLLGLSSRRRVNR